MSTTMTTTPSPEPAFGTVKRLLIAYGALSAAVLLAVAVRAAAGLSATSFMWSRSGAILGSAVLLYVLAVRAERGSRSAYQRVRAIAVIAPIAIVGVDLLPGLCPAWFAIAQAIGALPLVAVARAVNRARPTALSE
ncbi:hypothetical protein ACFYNO_02380 [Kitasatospora sp. NPDC006697]|uniref:hypothetical protein n=1 Tax=Kitasatospora sp. NPDC006697 TaxID=3364020 RepID=UPI0036BD4F6F